MKEQLKAKIYQVVDLSCREREIGVAFSGGIDSSLLAKVCKDLSREVKVLTIGFPGSRDVQWSKRIARELGSPLFVKRLKIRDLESDIKKILTLIGPGSLLDLEISLGLYHVAKLAAERGLKVLLTANGLDELFCGYERYRAILREKGEPGLREAISSEVRRALKAKAVQDKIASSVGVKKLDPFLSHAFVSFTLTLPPTLSIKSPGDRLRKHILREIALEIGVPRAAALRPKKAMQYSTRIHQEIARLAKGRFTKSKVREMGFRSQLEAYLSTILG